MSKKAEKVVIEEVTETVEVTETETEEVTEIEIVNETEGLTLEGFMDSEFADSLGYKKSVAYWKEFGAKAKVTGFRAKFYEALISGTVGVDSTLGFAEVNGGSKNDIKQISHFVAIAKLAADIREIVKAETVESAESE